MEAVRSLLLSLGVTPPKKFQSDNLFSDIDTLPAEDRAFVFLSSRGFKALDGAPLVTGSGGQFRPDAPMTQAEAAALVARAIPLTADSFQPPWLEPVIPQRQTVAQPQPPQQQPQAVQQPPEEQPAEQPHVNATRTLSPVTQTAIPEQPQAQPRQSPLPLPRSATQRSVRNIAPPSGPTRFLVVAASFTTPTARTN